MDSILAFLNQPIVLTLITLTAGSYLLGLVTERRARNNKLRDVSIDFFTGAGEIINSLVPPIYAHLRTGSTRTDDAILHGMASMFSRRMRIQVGSQAYLKSTEFAKRYDQLLD